MKKKQIFAILLAGTLAAGGAPVSAFAEAESVASESTEAAGEAESAGEAASESTTEAPAESTEAPAAPTEAPAEPTEAPAAPTEAPAEPTEAPAAPTEAPAAPTETPAEPTAEPTEAPAEETTADGVSATDTGIAIVSTTDENTETSTYYNTLQDAVNTVQAYSDTNTEATVIVVTKDLELSDTVKVDGGKKVAVKAAATASIKRAAGFTGDMFTVSDENSELQFGVKDNGVLTVSGTKGADADAVTGSIVSVGTGASFGILDGATLSGNDTTADGAAVNNNGGSVYLYGGTITDNAGAKGAVYSNKEVIVSGIVNVSENYLYADNARTETAANLYMDNSADSGETITDIKVAGDLTGYKIGVTLAKPAENAQILSVNKTSDGQDSVTADVFAAAAALFSYDTEDYTIKLSDDGTKAVLAKNEEPVPSAFLSYTSTGEAWNDFNTFTTGTFTASKECNWYYTTVKANSSDEEIQKTYDETKAENTVSAGSTFTVKVENVDSTTPWLVVWAVPADGSAAEKQVIKLNEGTINKNRPFISNVTTTWKNHDSMTVSLDLQRTGEIQYKASWMTSGSSNANTEPSSYSKSTTASKSPLNLTVSCKNKTTQWLVLWFKSPAGEVKQVIVKLDDANISNSRPAETTPTPTQAVAKSTVTLNGTPVWTDHTTLNVKFKNKGALSYYYEIVDKNSNGTWDVKKATNSQNAKTTSFTETVTDIPDDDTKKIIFWFKVNSQNDYTHITIKLSDLASKRPAAKTADRDPKVYKVSDSKVTGLDDAKKFWPKYFYPFTVTGAGTDIKNKDAVTGDVRWVPQYWTMSTQSGASQHTSWKIGSTNGIKTAGTYNMYIYFKKQTFNGKDWVDTGDVEYLAYTFKSAGYTDEEYQEWLKSGLTPDDPNYEGDYEEVEAELTATEAAEDKSADSASTSKSAVSTADESPIGSMTALAMLSALAGGYILVRKRKKEN